MPENTTNLTPQEVIVGLAKAIGVQVPDTYSSAFGTSVMDALTDRLNAHKANQPAVLTVEYVNQNAMNALIGEVAGNLGIEQDDAAEMVRNSGNAVATLNISATPVSLNGNPTSAVNPDNSSDGDGVTTRTETVTEPDRVVPQVLRDDIKLVQETFSGAIGRTNQMRDGILGDVLELPRPLTNISTAGETWNESSLGAVNAVIDLLKERNGLTGEFSAEGYTPALGQAIKDKIADLQRIADSWNPVVKAEDPLASTKLRVLNQILPEAQRNQVFAALDRLHAADELRPVNMVERQVTVTVPGGGDGNVTDNNGGDANDNNESSATSLDPNNADHANIISARDSIAGFAKFAGVAVPAQYTSDYGQAVISGLNSKFDAFKAARGGEWDAAAQDAWIVHVTEGMGLEVNDANKQLVIDGLNAREASVASLGKALTDGLSVTQTAWSPVSNNPAGNPNPNPNAVDSDFEKSIAIETVEGVLFQLGGSLDNIPGIGGMISQFGLADAIITPLSQDEIGGDFGANSQDLASKLIMGLKMINGDENPDGTYNNAIGQNLRLAILTKPEFSFVRDQIKASDGTSLRLFSGGGGALTGQSAESQQELARALLTFDETEPTAPGADATEEQRAQYQQAMERRAQFEQTHAKDLESVRQLNTFFKSMDLLQQEGVYDNEKAKQTNQTNLMMSAASGLMDQWMPGLKGWLQDFFTNSQFGQMISGVLSQFFGINVGRLWGDNDDAAALERSKPLIEDNFEAYYNQAKEELGEGADHAKVMARTQAAIMDTMTTGISGQAFKMGMSVIFKGQDDAVVQKAVEDALAAAQNSTDLASAQQVFSQSLLESGERFRGGATLDSEQLNSYLVSSLQETSREMQNAVASGFQVPGSGTPGQTTNENATNEDTSLDVQNDDDDGSQLGTSEAITAVVSPDGENRERQTNSPAVDAEVIEAGDKNVELIYNPNNANQMSGPTRYAHGRVDDIQAVLGDNAEALGLSLNAAGMKNSDGVYTDMLTPYTNAVIEETLIRAQIHELEEQNIVITQDHLDNFDRKLTLENLNTVTTYLQDQGVSAADVAKLSEAVIGADGAGIGTDYFSTSNTDRTAGPRQEHTVLEQSHFGNQFDLKLAQWVPDAAPVETDLTGDDPLRDQYLEYNKDKPCEIPLFFTRPGDTSVFAIIRDKNGNDDPSDDKFVELDMDLYLSTHKIQDGDADDLKALLDNYNWENPTDRGVRDVINKVLGLEPFQRSINMRAPEVTAETNTTPDVPVIPLVVPERTVQHDRPETIRDLRMVTDTQAAFLTEKLNLNDIPGVRETADRDVMHPLEVMFKQQMLNDRNPDGIVMLELDAHGISHPDMDVVLGYKNANGDMEFRFVDYETDAITPIPQQRQGNTDIVEGFDPQRHDYGARRLDDFVDEYERSPSGRVTWGKTDGYMGLMAIVPAQGSGLTTITAFQAVYGESLSRTNSRDYVASVAERSAYRTGYEVEQRNGRVPMPNHERRNDGLSDADKQRLDALARSGRVGTSGHYNDRSGHTHSHSHGSYSHTHPHSHDDEREYAASSSLTLKTYENTPGIIRGGATAFAAQIDALGRIFKNGPFRGNNFTIDDFSPEDQERMHRIMQGVRENQGDMNANPTDPYDRPVEEFLHGHTLGGNR